jgi:glycosyltransferase involved in cell wall biosynthesis
MLVSLIINTNNQYEFLNRAILSCLKQEYKNYEIIVVDLSKKKQNFIVNKYKKNNKIKFINLKEKYLYPTQNQLFGIKQALKLVKGKYIFLLDGDDFFSQNKIKFIVNKIKNQKLIMDFPIIFNEYKKDEKKKMSFNFLKNNFFYKKFINNWPGISCTSGMCVEKKNMDSFFKETKPFIWKNLAIDIQLSIYTKLKHNIEYIKENLTFKSSNIKNLDKHYAGFFLKKFWIRRKEQHDFNLSIKRVYFFKGFDYYITKFIVLFIKYFYKRF